MFTKKVREFTKACEENLPSKPMMIPKEKINFVGQMVFDEIEELKGSTTISEQADALVDAMYYLLDTAVKHGMNLDPIFDIVHETNLKKIVNGKVLRREDGKVIKPKDWQDPNVLIKKEIQRQQNEGSFIS